MPEAQKLHLNQKYNMDSSQDYKPFLSDVIKQLFVVIGSDVTLLKLKSIPELTITPDGNVTEITGNTENIIKKFKEVFSELSPGLVKTVIEPALLKTQHAEISFTPSGSGTLPGLPA